MATSLRVTVWNEYRHEREANHPASQLYPHGIHGASAQGLREQPGFKVRTATLDEPEHGLTDAALDQTDVLIWWGHAAHGEVRGEICYFRPGHETYPTYFNPEVRRVIANAARWAAPSGGPRPVFGNARPRE